MLSTKYFVYGNLASLRSAPDKVCAYTERIRFTPDASHMLWICLPLPGVRFRNVILHRECCLNPLVRLIKRVSIRLEREGFQMTQVDKCCDMNLLTQGLASRSHY